MLENRDKARQIVLWQDIKDLFKQFGEVNHVKIIKDRDTGKSK